MANRFKTLKITGLALIIIFFIYGFQGQIEQSVPAFARSIEKEKKLDYPGAIKCIQDLNDTTSYENNLRLGWLYYKLGREKRSLMYYQNAINLNPKAIEPRIGFAFPAYLLEDMSQLIDQYKKILEIDPANKSATSNLGLVYYYNKEYAKALPYFQKIVQAYPFDYDNNLTLAWIYLRLNKNADAEKYFNIVLLYSPTDASAKEGLENIGKPTTGDAKLMGPFVKSHTLAGEHNYKGAAAAIKDIYDKSSYIINIRLAWLLHLAGQETESALYYKIAMELNPTAIEAKLGYAIPTEKMGNKNELYTIYESVLALDPQNTVVNYKLGYLYYNKKEYDKALPYFEKIYNLYPFDYDGLLMYAWTKYQTNSYDESRVLFNKVLCIVPEDRSAKLGLSYKPVDEQKKLETKEILRPR